MISDKLRALIAKELGHDPELGREVRLALAHGHHLVFLGEQLGCAPPEMIGLKKIQAAYANEQLPPEERQPSS